VREPITSPTFTLHRRYQGRLRLEHLDVYRLELLEEAADLDLPELIEGGSVTLVEWGDRIRPALPEDHLDVELSLGDGDDERIIRLQPRGSSWDARRDALAGAVGPWRVPAPDPERAAEPASC
jgi:tRNA threonylcarbamoyladenosine biosynthesis protein TsaE